MSEVVKCIDISHWQNFPNFTEVRAAGVIAMIHKATEGSSYVDPNRAKNISNAIKAGIKCCTYHWIKPGNASNQMDFYLKTIDPVPGERVVIDYEEDGCSLDDLHEAVQTLLDDPRGLQITVYSGHLLKEQLSSHDELLAKNTDLWLAQYTSGTPTWSTETYSHWALWQYSESGTVNGIDGSLVDLNRFDGTDDELLAWISPAGSVKPPKPKPVPAQIDITVIGDVTISINGKVVT
jgi:lysozyme